MKTSCRYKIRNFALAVTLSAGLGFVSPASSQVVSYLIDPNSGKVTQLGSLGGGNTQPYGINDSGRVVGVSRTNEGFELGFITGPDGVGITVLDTADGSVTGINDAGQVVGWSQSGAFGHAFITGPNGRGMIALGTEAGYSRATGINNAGQVVGFLGAFPVESSTNAFLTGPNGEGMTFLDAGNDDSRAAAVNDAGQVVGVRGLFYTPVGPDVPSVAFITGPAGKGMTDLGTLGGSDSYATGINDAGRVVGWSFTAGVDGPTYQHAFITGPDGKGMTDLGALGGSHSFAYGINDAGQVVGSFETAGGGTHAFITGPDGRGMVDLNSLVNLPDGVILTDARDINNLGQVIAIGIIPEPASYALMLSGLALVGFMVRGKKQAV